MTQRGPKTLRIKMVTAFVLVTILILIGTWLLTRYVLPKVYLESEITDLVQTFDSVEEILKGADEYTDETTLRLKTLMSGKTFFILVMDTSQPFARDPLYSNGTNALQERMMELELMKVQETYGITLSNSHWNARVLTESDRYQVYQMESVSEQGSIIQGNRSEDETAARVVEKTGGTFIDLRGYAGNQYYVYLSLDYKRVTRATSIATDLQLRVAVGILFLASIVIYILCRMVTRPIEKMCGVAERMCEMDFEARCPEDRTDEIGDLGRSLNVLSERLEDTIGDLKKANNELQHDIREKEEIENMRKDFISNVSHELKTPIALIQGYAEGLQDNINDDAESRNYYCEVIIDEAAKMNGIVKKLLSLNQLEYGAKALEYDRFNIFDVLRGVLRDTEILQKQQDVIVHFYDDGPCYVWADEYRIEEVVTNYVSNAFHHVSKSKEIAVSVKKTDATVRVSVYNTGEQIPEEDLDKVWIKFYKVDKARTREYGGTGIGLSVVKAVMDAHNQKCGVINHEGGVEFWFELEAADGRNEKKQEQKKTKNDSSH
ncbi:MAG: HAMP domain-containing protein [Lachnospiraceae bacterium]|nr:HAMP domain-containing protein [Lachnospiraceae bacterium]